MLRWWEEDLPHYQKCTGEVFDLWKSSRFTIILAIGISLLFCTSNGINAQQAPLGSLHDSLNSKANIGHNPFVSPAAISNSDPWSYFEYTSAIEGIFDTFDYFNLTKYGGGWQYEVTRTWTDRAFTYGKYIIQDAECIVGLLSAYNLTKDAKYLRYAEAIWNWDQASFFDDVYGGYHIRLNQDNSIAIGDKSMFEHGWYALATAQLYAITGNSTYLGQVSYIYRFITDYFYDPADGSYYGSLNRDLSILVSAVDTNWCAPYARFLMTAYEATGNNTYRNKAIELVDNLINHAYDSQHGWIVNRVTSDWSSFTNSAKGWYDVLQTFIDAYRILGDTQYLTFAQTCFNDIQQANSSAGYLMEMNRDWTSVVNNQLLGEEDPGVAIAYLRIAQELGNASILKEAYRYKDAIYNGLYDPVYGGIYRRIDASGSQDTWKQWCGAGRVIEMLSDFAMAGPLHTTAVLVWGDADPNGHEKAGHTIAENLEDAGLNVTFVSDFSELDNELSSHDYKSLVLVDMPWTDTYSDIPASIENKIESMVSTGELGLVGFHDIIWQNAHNPVLQGVFGGTLASFVNRDSIYSIVNSSHPVTKGLPDSFALDDDQLLRGSWGSGVNVIMKADYLNTPVVVANRYNDGKTLYMAAGGDAGYSGAIANNDTNLVQLYRNAVMWVSGLIDESGNPSVPQTGNMALYFDGSDELVVPDDSSLNPTNAITVMAWINADDWNGNRRILQKGVDDQYRLIKEGNLEFSLAGIAGADIETTPPTTGIWHHVAGTYDGETIRLYVDGAEKASRAVSGQLQVSTTPLYIGNKPLSSYPGDRFKGIIDEVRIYNRALTGAEINVTRTNTAPSSNGLALYFSFNNIDGNTCPDSSPFGNDGTNHGAEWVSSFEWRDVGGATVIPPTAPHFTRFPAVLEKSTTAIEWNASTSVNGTIESYTLQIDGKDSFDAPDSVTAYSTQYELIDLVNGTYYAHVRANDEFGYSSAWSETRSFTVTIPFNHPPSVPMLQSYYLTSPNGTVTVRWQQCTDPDGQIAEYQIQICNDRLFTSSVSQSTKNTTYTFSDLSDGSHFFRIRARDNLSVCSQWSQMLEVVVYTGFPVITHHPAVTVLETTSGASIVWEVESEYPFSYCVYRNETVVQSADRWTGNVSINIGGESVGVYSYSLVITDMIGRNWTDTVLVTVEPDTGRYVLAVAAVGGVGAGIVACLVVALVLVNKRRTKTNIDSALNQGRPMMISDIAEMIGKPEKTTIGLIKDCNNAFLSDDQKTVVPISYLKKAVQDEFDRTGYADLVQISNNLGINPSHMETIQLTNDRDLIRTENMTLLRRDVAIEKIRELFLSSDESITMQRIRDTMPVSERTFNNLLASSNLTILFRPDGSMAAIDPIIEKLIEDTKEEGVLPLKEFVLGAGLSTEEFSKAIRNKRFDEIYVLASADLTLSLEWIATFRNELRANREATITRLEHNPALSEQQVDKILSRFDPGNVDIIEQTQLSRDAPPVRGTKQRDRTLGNLSQHMVPGYGRVREPLPSRRSTKKSSEDTGMMLVFAGIILLMFGLMSWAVYIPVFSQSLLGEIGGSVLICIGMGKMNRE